MSSAAERVRENVTGIVSMVITGIWLVGLFTGQGWWLPFMLFGYIVVVPIVAILAGDEEGIEEWGDDLDLDVDREDRAAARGTGDENALETLRDRYARGELTDEQFERKVERLLETETIEDIEDRQRRVEREKRELERERN